MKGPRVWIEKGSESDLVIGVFCSRECAKSYGAEPSAIEKVYFPASGRGLTGYAVALLECGRCGDNLADKVSR